MKNFLIYILAFNLLFGNSFKALAQNIDTIPSVDNLCKTGYSVFFINGILNTKAAAIASKNKIKKLKLANIKQIGDNKFTYKGEDLRFDILYNTTNGGMADLFEAYKQKREKRAQFFSSKTLQFVLITLFGVSPDNKSLKGLPQPIKDYIIATRAAIDKETIAFTEKTNKALFKNIGNSADIVKAKEILEADLLEKRKVAIFAHSQGNLFSEQLFSELNSDYKSGAVKWIHVATPSTTTINGAKYFTAKQDVVIGGVRKLYGALPATHELPINYLLSDAAGHGFSEIYLNSNLSQTLYKDILSAYDNSLNTIIPANTTGKTGAFTVGMTWNGSGDIDLHVVEPNGTGVFYENKIGLSGELDTDNRIEDGPEHYSASCDAKKVEEGVYQVFAKNYARANGKTARILLKSNISNKTFVSKSVYFSQDKEEIPVFNIKVTNKIQNGRRVFTVDLM